MKKIALVVMLVAGGSFFLLSCKEENEQKKLLVSKWKLTDWILMPQMNISDSMKAELMKNATMEFTEDNRFIFIGMSPEPTTGVYRLWENGRTLTLTPDKGTESYNHIIDTLTDVKLVLIDPIGNNLVCTH